MSDAFDRLSRALDAATPEPDEAARNAALRLAQENFDRLQESTTPARPTPERAPLARIVAGVTDMLERIGIKGALVASTGVAVVAAVWVSQNAQVLAPGEIVVTDAAQIEEEQSAGARAPTDAKLRDESLAQTGVPSAAPAPRENEAQVMSEPELVEDFAAPQSLAADQALERRAAESEGIHTPFGTLAPPAPSMADDTTLVQKPDTEAYANAPENDLKIVTGCSLRTSKSGSERPSTGCYTSS